MAIKRFEQQELDQFHSEHRAQYRGLKEDYFALLYLVKKFGLRIEDAAHQVAFGNRDYGFDAYHIDRSARNLFLYQFKWSENHNLFKDSLDRIAVDGITRIFGNPFQDENQNELITRLKSELDEN